MLVGKKVLVTGGAGFIGSSLCHDLLERGNEVICLDNFATGKKENIKDLKGNPKFSSEYDGAKYLFASAEHKALFDANAANYAPAYGGYCGYAASIDRLSPVSPEWFQIDDGKLILQHNKKAFDLFNKELKDNVKKADVNWPGLLARNGVYGGKTLVFTD